MRTKPLGQLGDTHMGRTVTIHGLTGTLTGLFPVNDTYTAALIVGGARAWTDALPADTPVTIHPKAPR